MFVAPDESNVCREPIPDNWNRSPPTPQLQQSTPGDLTGRVNLANNEPCILEAGLTSVLRPLRYSALWIICCWELGISRILGILGIFAGTCPDGFPVCPDVFRRFSWLCRRVLDGFSVCPDVSRRFSCLSRRVQTVILSVQTCPDRFPVCPDVSRRVSCLSRRVQTVSGLSRHVQTVFLSVQTCPDRFPVCPDVSRRFSCLSRRVQTGFLSVQTCPD
jgi:hypothetical protein